MRFWDFFILKGQRMKTESPIFLDDRNYLINWTPYFKGRILCKQEVPLSIYKFLWKQILSFKSSPYEKGKSFMSELPPFKVHLFILKSWIFIFILHRFQIHKFRGSYGMHKICFWGYQALFLRSKQTILHLGKPSHSVFLSYSINNLMSRES